MISGGKLPQVADCIKEQIVTEIGRGEWKVRQVSRVRAAEGATET